MIDPVAMPPPPAPPVGILAVIFGGIGVSRANQGAPNRSMAVAGLVLGIAGLVVGILFIALITTSAHQVDHVGPSVQSA